MAERHVELALLESLAGRLGGEMLGTPDAGEPTPIFAELAGQFSETLFHMVGGLPDSDTAFQRLHSN
ncbi:hypothetical protein AB0M02_33790 [Actinoplanes sp. NPDC051861]|uniref:hypothetical protein n=1 Tax=Actinoplanes sp. NPDC051861 TaxID=3155170 RepID=UPI00341F089A